MVLTELAVDRNYEISVCAVNSQGAGPGGTPAVVWVGEAVPTAPPRDVTAEALSPTEVALTWKPPALAQQNGDLLGYKVGIPSFIDDIDTYMWFCKAFSQP